VACSVAGCWEKWKNTKASQTVSFATLRLIEKDLLEGISLFSSLFYLVIFTEGTRMLSKKKSLLLYKYN